MEEKELDFSELLKEHIGEMFFSYMYGDVILRDVNRSFCSFVTNNGNGDKVRVFSLCPLKTGYAPILPFGTIKKLIGRELTWEDEPVELK